VSEAQRISDEYDAKHNVRCPVCAKRLCPQKNGKVRGHSRDLHVGTFVRTEKCPGSGRIALRSVS
jgi:hypothetical protein